MPDLPNPHDRYFKEVVTRIEAARDIVRNYLPREIVQRLDLDSMELVQDSWTDPELRQHFADVVYRLKWLDPSGEGGEVHLVILFEHKSHPDRLTALQLLRYMVQHWQAHLDSGSSLPLPQIIPLVVYHGEADWKIPRNFSSLFGAISEDLRSYVPHFDYELLDLSLNSPREIVGSPLVRATFQLLQAIFAPDLAARLPGILKTLAQDSATGVESLETAVLYVVSASALDQTDVSSAVTAAVPRHKEKLMTTLAEKWFQEGKDAGILQGKEVGLHEGEELGLRKGLCLSLTRQITRRFGILAQQSLRQDLEKLSMTNLELLTEDLIDLSTLDELKAWLAQRD